MVGAALAGAFGFGEQPGRSPADTVVAKLAGADVLLVLDNCERLLDGSAPWSSDCWQARTGPWPFHHVCGQVSW
jgi:predicted ATPase